MSAEAAAIAAAAAAASASPHVLLIRFPGQGHVNPMLRLAKRIAAKGLLVTCSSSSRVADKLTASSGLSALGDRGVPIGRCRLRFEFLEDRFGGNDLDDLMQHLATAGPPAFAELLRRQAAAGRPVSCVVGNPFIPWAIDVAAVADAILDQFRNMGKASWVFVNSFSELERDVLAALPSVTPRPPQLIPVGPLIELHVHEDGAVRGDLIKASDDCVEWLDAQEPRSVVYASVSSVVRLSSDEVAEMAHGLASTGRPFLWVVRPDTRPLLPEGFLDAVGDCGMVVPWSPQDRVLAHSSTACFLTHCGWSSTLETVAAGVPVLAFPQWGDQCTDAEFLVDELRMGVRLRVPLRREAVREAVDAAVAGPEADAMLASARSWSVLARAAVAPGGSSDRNVQAFVEEVSRRACGAQGVEV